LRFLLIPGREEKNHRRGDQVNFLNKGPDFICIAKLELRILGCMARPTAAASAWRTGRSTSLPERFLTEIRGKPSGLSSSNLTS